MGYGKRIDTLCSLLTKVETFADVGCDHGYCSEDMLKIERIVPMYPYSRDEIAYERLIKILSLYRLTLGQARQEELLEYIFDNCENTDDMKKLFINLSPYYKDFKKE